MAQRRLRLVGELYAFSAVDDQGNPVTMFSDDITLSIKYDPTDLTDLLERDLALYFYSSSKLAWEYITSSPMPGERVTGRINHFTVFGIFGTPIPEPTTLFLLGIGLLSMVVFVRKSRKWKK
jgi:hypothetical protein